jgi:hypothetical protein
MGDTGLANLRKAAMYLNSTIVSAPQQIQFFAPNCPMIADVDHNASEALRHCRQQSDCAQYFHERKTDICSLTR